MRGMQQQLGNLGTISAFACRHRETKKNLCQGGQSQDLLDIYIYIHFFFLFMAQQPLVGQSLIYAAQSHSETSQHSQQTDNHTSGGIWTCKPSKQAATGPNLRPRRHWVWPNCHQGSTTYVNCNLQILLIRYCIQCRMLKLQPVYPGSGATGVLK